MTLGLDVAAAVARAVVVSEDGRIVARAEHPMPRTDRSVAVTDTVRKATASVQKNIVGVGIAFPVPGDAPPEEALTAIGSSFSDVTPITVPAGTAAAIAETWCGAARDVQTVATFAIGERVTAGVIIDGKPWFGAHGYASSVGWLALNPVEREDYRRLGSLEAEVSIAGVVRRFVWRIKSGDRSTVVDQVKGDLSRVTVEAIFQGARTGDGVCISVVRDTAKYVGMAVANLATIIDPDAVVLGGMLATADSALLESIRFECSRRMSPAQSDRIQIVMSTLGEDAVAIGAARAAALQSR